MIVSRMRALEPIAAAFGLCLAALPGPADAAPREVRADANFVLFDNCGMPDTNSYRLLIDGLGQHRMAFQLDDGDTGGCRSDRGPKLRERAELRSAWLEKDTPYSLRFRAKFENPDIHKWHSIFQIHQNDPDCVFLKMEMHPEGINLFYRDPAMQETICAQDGKSTAHVTRLFEGNGFQGRWLDVQIEMILSDGPNGRIAVFVDDERRALIEGANSLFTPYLKFGLYRIPKFEKRQRVPDGTATLLLDVVALDPPVFAAGYPRR